jgi:hypothetical protein
VSKFPRGDGAKRLVCLRVFDIIYCVLYFSRPKISPHRVSATDLLQSLWTLQHVYNRQLGRPPLTAHSFRHDRHSSRFRPLLAGGGLLTSQATWQSGVPSGRRTAKFSKMALGPHGEWRRTAASGRGSARRSRGRRKSACAGPRRRAVGLHADQAARLLRCRHHCRRLRCRHVRQRMRLRLRRRHRHRCRRVRQRQRHRQRQRLRERLRLRLRLRLLRLLLGV